MTASRACPHPVRRLLATAATAVAALAGCGGGEGKQTVVVKVGDAAITAEQMEARLKSLPPQVAEEYQGEEGQRRFLDGFIEEETWVQAALAAGLEEDSEVRRQIENARRRILIQNYFNRELRPYQVLTEQQLREHYEEEIDRYTKPREMKVRHVQVATREEAERLRKQILDGANMSMLAKRFSTNEDTAPEGGLLGYVAEKSALIPYIGGAPEMTRAIDSLEVNVISPVIPSPVGFQVLRVEEVVEAQPAPFDKVKEVVRRTHQPAFEEEVRLERLEKLKQEFGVVYVQKGLEQTAQAREEEAQRLFQQAQESTQWQERIDLYQEFLRRYPDHPRHAEALFMLGFVYAEELKDYAKAQETFMELLRDYPDSKLAKDAQFMLDNLGAEEPPPPSEAMDEDAAG